MADLNSMIAQGAQFQAPVDPFAQYGKLQQLQQNQQANALNQMKMDEYVRGQQESNALRQFLPGLNETNRSQLLGYGAAGQGVFKALGEGDTQRRLAEQATSQAAVNKSNILKNAVAQTRDAVAGIDPTDASSYMALRESVLAQYPELAPHMPAAWDANVKQRLITTAASVLEGQKPAAQPTSIAEFERAQKDPRFMKFLQERAAAMRPPAAPRAEPAPTVTSIQDPTNPSQMISINARDYRGGGIGSPGVIGLTGKTPAATAKQDAIDKGNAQLSSVLDDLRSSYDTLEKAAAIPSTQRGVLSNLASSAQASGLGQALGRMGGTEEQSARDTINSSRMMLLNSIKQATGMSAQQLNSNVELKSWLQAVSDPTQSIETVSKVLNNIEKFVASGGKYSAKKEGAPVAIPGKPAPAEAGVAPPPGFKRD